MDLSVFRVSDARYPLVRFSTLPADTDLGWHQCPDLAGEPRESDVAIHYRRWGFFHGLTACGLCVRSELAELHYGNPQPIDVTVQERAEQDEERAA